MDQIRAELEGEAGTGQHCRFREACGPSREHLYGLMHFYDVNTKMPRDTVERLAELVRQAVVRWLQGQGLAEDDLLVRREEGGKRERERAGGGRDTRGLVRGWAVLVRG